VRARGTAAPAFVTDLDDVVTRRSAPAAARAHLAAHVARYGIDDPAADLEVIDVVEGSGTKTVRFGQREDGVEVFGAQYLVHMREEASGFRIASVNGHFFTSLTTPTDARLDETTARRLAVARLRPISVGDIESHGLVVLPSRTGVLTYHFTITGTRFGRPVKQEVFVNARTGALALSYNDLHYVDTTGTGQPADADRGTVALNLFRRGTVFTLRDRQRAMFDPVTRSGQIVTYNARGRDAYGPGAAGIVTSADDSFDARASTIGAVDAHWGTGETYEYFLSLGRDSLDGNGMSLVSTVNATEFGQPMYNAFWDGSQVVYGFPNDGVLYPFSAELDIVAHELTHGVTDFSAQLVYLNESGAMNEAYSDYFGNALDVDSSGTAMGSPESGYVGEDLCVQDGDPMCPFRDMNDGRTTDDFGFYLIDLDNGGVHLNSTIYSGALWNLRQSIDRGIADEIVLTTLTQFLTPLDGLLDGRRATIEAAGQVGDPSDYAAQQQAVRDAYDAQGIASGWLDPGANDARIVRRNVAPVGIGLSPHQISGTRYIIGDHKRLTQICCTPQQIFVGPIDGSGSVRRVGQHRDPRTFTDELPDISGRTAVWAHLAAGDFDVNGRTLGGRLRAVAASPRAWEWFPSIDGRVVAYERVGADADTDVYARVLGTRRVLPVATGPGEQYNPQVSGNWVAYWHGSAKSVSVRNLRTGATRTISGGRRAFLGPPAIGGRYMYWYQDDDFLARTADFFGAIKRAPLGGGPVETVVGSARTSSPYWEGLAIWPTPAANGRYVAYSSELGHAQAGGADSGHVGRDVYVVAGRGGSPVRVTLNRGDQAFPALAEGRTVVWLDASLARTDLMTRRRPAG
jgi:Zn-dependent metalloprotease